MIRSVQMCFKKSQNQIWSLDLCIKSAQKSRLFDRVTIYDEHVKQAAERLKRLQPLLRFNFRAQPFQAYKLSHPKLFFSPSFSQLNQQAELHSGRKKGFFKDCKIIHCRKNMNYWRKNLCNFQSIFKFFSNLAHHEIEKKNLKTWRFKIEMIWPIRNYLTHKAKVLELWEVEEGWSSY